MKITLTARDEVHIAVRCLKNYARLQIVTHYNDMVKFHNQLRQYNQKLTWFQRWYTNYKVEKVDNHPEALPNFDLPLADMINNYHKWVRTFDYFGLWDEPQDTFACREAVYVAIRANNLADLLNGSTHLYRMTVELDASDSEFLVKVLNACPPNENILR